MDSIPEIPGYKIINTLGQGGMATVYLGVQQNLDREVAIKVLSPEMFKDAQYRTRFLNEAHTASKLSHPNIVTIHDVGEIRGYCYIVMERLQENLTEKVKFRPDGKMSPGKAFKIIKQISEALDYAHKEGFIHRDIKPDNILFRKDGTPVLVDFGIARALDSQSRLTSTGMIIGTPHYMSPEQCKGEAIDAQSDFYSLGVVLYEILTGCVPYNADSTAGILFKQVQEPIPQLPPGLEKYQPIIVRMMAKIKRERIHSGTELITMLDKLGPDSRFETVKTIRGDEWVFDRPPEEKITQDYNANDASDLMTLQSPIKPQTMSHSTYKSKSPLVVILISVPFILAAIYFLFFHTPSPTPDHPVNESTTSKEKVIEVNETNLSSDGTKGNSDNSGNTLSSGNTATPAKSKPQAETLGTAGGPDEKYRRHLSMAEEYFKSDKYDKALENLELARAEKDTEEVRNLEAEIKKQVQYLKEKEYLKYFNLANQEMVKKHFATARKHLQTARQFKDTDDAIALGRRIDAAEKKKQDRERRARLAAERKRRLQKQDDQAYNRAKSRNTIYAYEKYLEKYPKGRHAVEAQKKHDQTKQAAMLENRITDDHAFETAKRKNTIVALEDYIRTHPLGRHKDDAKTGIKALKEKLLKETKVKLSLQSIRFFESGRKAPPMENRNYGTRFTGANTRFIHAELTFKNNLYRVADIRTPLLLVYTGLNGSFKFDVKGQVFQESASSTCIYCRGMGWTTAGKWPAGKYHVTVYLQGSEIGKSQFEIY